MQPDMPPPLPPKTRTSMILPDTQPGGQPSSPTAPPLPPRSRLHEPPPPQPPPRSYYYHKRDGDLHSSFRRDGDLQASFHQQDGDLRASFNRSSDLRSSSFNKSRTIKQIRYDLPDEPPPLPPPLAPRKPAELVFGTDRVSGLSFKTYEEFIADKEKALIMFYDSTDSSDPAIAGEFGLAAASPQNKKYAYGAVDCAADPVVCCHEKVSSLPVLKLYSNGFEVSTLRSLENFTSAQMKMLIAMAPVLTQPRAEKQR